MPLIVFLFFILLVAAIFSQLEMECLFGMFWGDFLFIYFSDMVLPLFDCFSFSNFFFLDQKFHFSNISATELDYNYNYRTFFSQTYLHEAYNKRSKAYRNLLHFDRLFGDYNVRTFGKKKSHARNVRMTQLFLLLYSHTMNCYAFSIDRWSDPFIFFYFKRQHLYSVLEMFWVALYLGIIYFFTFTYIRLIEQSTILSRETEEIDEEDSQYQFYYYREDREGMYDPRMEDNEELDFAFRQRPWEWDEEAYGHRMEITFIIFFHCFLISWGQAQTAASMFYMDEYIDLHFVGWINTFIFIGIFWRIFFYTQFFLYFGRFSLRKFFYVDFLFPKLFSSLSFLLSKMYVYVHPFFSVITEKKLKIFQMQTSVYSGMEKSLFFYSRFVELNTKIVKFYKYIYSSFQKNLNLFGKRSLCDILLASNIFLLHYSEQSLDSVHYSVVKKDGFLVNVLRLVDSYISEYRLANGFYVVKNLYLPDNRVDFMDLLPIFPFPFYLDYYNIVDLPIWGADSFFSLAQNTFSFIQPSESWFFANRYRNADSLLNDILNEK